MKGNGTIFYLPSSASGDAARGPEMRLQVLYIWTGSTPYFLCQVLHVDRKYTVFSMSGTARGPEVHRIFYVRCCTWTGSTPYFLCQVLHVDRKCSIKEYVQRNSLLFKAGRGFYEFTKPEIISGKKEVVLLDKNTGDMFTGIQE